MLKTVEGTLKKGKTPILLVDSSKKKNKFKKNKRLAPKVEAIKQTGDINKDNPKEKGNCFHCKKNGHWKRNCKLYLEELKKTLGKSFDYRYIYG